MPSPAAHWAEIKALFDATAHLAPALREAPLAAAALPADALVELRSLLAHHDAATGGADFLAGVVAPVEVAAAVPLAAAAGVGQRLGAWQIVRAIGAGGMGEVFEARRADGTYEGRAAVKLLKRGMDSAAVLQRFALERQALARLNHPHIARLLDAGASADGLPYFVLEHVDGQPIDQAIKPLALAQRLALFLQLADAVAHAHRNLLVHRDLKPGNVLVDGDGQVKLLDFGIAKALDPLDGTDGADGNTTIGGVRPYTPNYASPEQVRGEPVNTATDIYSLGVLLYQMLTGTRPTGRRATTPAEAARSVLEDAPTRPSRLSPAEAPDPQWLLTRKKLVGDLDNILLKALEKSPERRYASVDALAADVRAYLAGRPVSAHAAGAGYIVGKFVWRNRLPVALASLALLALVGGLAGSAWQAQRAQQARQVAESRLAEVRRITHELVFGFGDSVEYLPGGMQIKADLFGATLAALQRLAPTLGNADSVLADMAQVHVRLAEAHASGYPASLNQPDTAKTHAAAAMALVERVWPTQQADPVFANYATRAYSVQASIEREGGAIAQAAATSRKGLQVAEQALAAAPAAATGKRLLLQSAVTASRLALATLLDDNGVGLDRPAEAMVLYQAALASGLQEQGMTAAAAELDAAQRTGHTRFLAELGKTLGIINGSMSSSHVRRGDYAAAIAARRGAVQQLRQSQQMHPGQLQFWESLGTSLAQQAALELQLGDAVAALRSSTESLAWNQRLLAQDPTNTEYLDDTEFRALTHGSALAQTGAQAQAVPWLQRAVRYWRQQAIKSGSARAKRSAPLAEVRLARALAAAGRNGSNADVWMVGSDATKRLQALVGTGKTGEPGAGSGSGSGSGSADGWLALGEAAAVLAGEGPIGDRPQWAATACDSWRQAVTLRPLPPVAQAAQRGLCVGAGGGPRAGNTRQRQQ